MGTQAEILTDKGVALSFLALTRIDLERDIIPMDKSFIKRYDKKLKIL
jgi:hypothetical protein